MKWERLYCIKFATNIWVQLWVFLQTHKCVTEVVETVLSLLVKDVPEHIKNCAQYHDLLNDLVKLVSYFVHQAILKNVIDVFAIHYILFIKLVIYLYKIYFW